MLLESISASLPIEMIYSDYSTHPRDVMQPAADKEHVLDRLRRLKQVLYGNGPGGDPEAFRQVVLSTCLFNDQLESVEDFITEAFPCPAQS